MATFSVNQTRHLYVVNSLQTSAITDSNNDGAILVKADTNKTTLYFQYKSPGGVVASDKINLKNVVSTKVTPSGDMEKKLDRVKISLNADVNSGDVIANQDYVVKVKFEEYIGISPEDVTYKYATVHTHTGMTASKLFKELASELVKTMVEADRPFLKVYVHSAASKSVGGFDASGFMEVTKGTVDDGTKTTTNSYYDGTSDIIDDIDSIEVEQVVGDWALGVMPQTYMPFIVAVLPVRLSGEDVLWADIENVTPVNVQNNGHVVADMEYFYLGERGDIYRNVGFPNVIHTKYLVDETQPYDTLDITYFYAGANEDIQKSQRTITLVTEDDGSHTDMKALVAKINTVSGLGITNLS